jgi:hypothetical protein
VYDVEVGDGVSGDHGAAPFGESCTAYPVTGVPPSDGGAVQVTVMTADAVAELTTVQVVPESVPPLGHEYVTVGAVEDAVVHVDPDKVPPLGQE